MTIKKKFERQEEINGYQERINAAQKEAYSNDIQNKLIELLEEKLELKEIRIQQIKTNLISSRPSIRELKSTHIQPAREIR